MLTETERIMLRRARASIEAEQEWYICAALVNLATGPNEMKAALRLKKYIWASLNVLPVTLEAWQGQNGYWNRTCTQLRADRVAWITWMLDEK
jgi:hypothetical protein